MAKMDHVRHLAGAEIHGKEGFDVLVRKLGWSFNHHVDSPATFEDFQKGFHSHSLQPLISYLVNETHHPAVVSALLALKWHFTAAEDDDGRGINQTRGLACELVAWRYVTHLNQKETIDALCLELPTKKARTASAVSSSRPYVGNDLPGANGETERTPLLDEAPMDQQSDVDDDESMRFEYMFAGLNALEIAAVADAKKFLSQNVIQRFIDGLWKGDIVFWETLSTHSTKQAKMYNQQRSDPFCRLRVPRYLKLFEVAFFGAFLAIYYALLIQKPNDYISASEILLYVWLAAFAYNELGEFKDAGTALYSTDFWALWDIGIIVTGVAFFVIRTLGLAKHNDALTEVAFDVLSVEALFLVPRICSLLSLHPYFGTLLPCLKEMTKDFVKFLGLVAILYLGFDTCFSFLARGTYSFSQMNWILIKVFFGSSYLGFDVAEKISPVLGPPLMFIFVCLTNILLITSLISLLSNSLSKVIEHAREEYLFVYAVYVLEASTSNRLTYFLPPLNLVPLLLRPLRLVVPAESLRKARIVILKATHWPFVALILGYERGQAYWQQHGRGTTAQRGSNVSAALLRRPTPVGALQRPLLAAGTRSLPGRVHVNPRRPSPVATCERRESLERAMAGLREQMDQLSTVMAQTQAAMEEHERTTT
ncbi:Hypothetical protein R9X50_00750800 [Acrodontium crateriforme]|uniref:Calcium channel YVC1-like C-terminal transmembrane domain-containing protein n=1 Tax=Acrodontium crateriforme TaxID=150365 RepID=A0AAQ3MCZ3_9PEZI|nr:Hypothetical protein R9X50_00750800 [Acrodontium crateriforme]